MKLTRTQRCIDRYCSYIDKLIELWSKPNDYKLVNKYIQLAEFLHHLLGVNKINNWYLGKLVNPNIECYYIDIGKFVNNKQHQAKQLKEVLDRKKHALKLYCS